MHRSVLILSQLLKKRLKAADHLARDDLRQRCGIEDDDLPPRTFNSCQGELDIEAVLCLAMRQLYNLGIGTSSFKVSFLPEYLLMRVFSRVIVSFRDKMCKKMNLTQTV